MSPPGVTGNRHTVRMMTTATRWLLGTSVEEQDAGMFTQLPSLTLNIDDLKEFYTKLESLYDEVKLTSRANVDNATLHELNSIDELLALSLYDRAVFAFTCTKTDPDTGNQGYALFNFNMNGAAICQAQGHDYISKALFEEALGTLRAESGQRLSSRNRLRITYSLSFALYAAAFAYICYQYASAKTTVLLIFAGVAAFAAWPSVRHVLEITIGSRAFRSDGLRILEFSRRKLKEDRANRWANARAGLVGVVLGAVLTALFRLVIK